MDGNLVSTLAVMATIAGAAGGSMLWLESRFRSMEKLIYREMEKHRQDDDTKFSNHGTRIQRLELKEFGFTQIP